MPRKHLYTVPDMEAADRLAQIASDALKAARERGPDQDERAHRLFWEIYGPWAQDTCNAETTDKAVG